MKETVITMEMVQAFLADGMIVKNYQELCTILGIPSTGGGYKKVREKELSRCCEWYKSGHKIVIVRIYDVQQADMDRRYRGRVADVLDPVLVRYLRESGKWQGTATALLKRAMPELDAKTAAESVGKVRESVYRLQDLGYIEVDSRLVVMTRGGVRDLTAEEEEKYEEAIKEADWECRRRRITGGYERATVSRQALDRAGVPAFETYDITSNAGVDLPAEWLAPIKDLRAALADVLRD